MLDMLPEHDQNLALELVRKMVLAWDSDFTKLTKAERARIEQAEEEMSHGEYTTHDAIDWN